MRGGAERNVIPAQAGKRKNTANRQQSMLSPRTPIRGIPHQSESLDCYRMNTDLPRKERRPLIASGWRFDNKIRVPRVIRVTKVAMLSAML